MQPKIKHIASVSWGKDSVAMLLLIIKNNLPIDEVIFFDTGVEFDTIYKVRDKIINQYLIPLNIKYVELKPKQPFMYKMLDYEYKTRSGLTKKGYGWCGGMCRWGTTEKTKTIDKYCEGAIQYIGIAYDEPTRYARLPNNKKAPLYDYKITEAEALKICYQNGFDFEGLYKILKRVSCWCCRNKNLKELRAYKEYLPKYYNKLIELENKIGVPMKPPYFLNERKL